MDNYELLHKIEDSVDEMLTDKSKTLYAYNMRIDQIQNIANAAYNMLNGILVRLEYDEHAVKEMFDVHQLMMKWFGDVIAKATAPLSEPKLEDYSDDMRFIIVYMKYVANVTNFAIKVVTEEFESMGGVNW